MERGVYFDGWMKDNHCYHPSLPLRSMQMIEDLERFHGTMLVWASMGGGSISLPYLHHEAFGPVDPRMRYYGYMNDSEFVKECGKRGIKVFAIVFEVQGWEFPAVIDEKGQVLLMNKNAEEADHDWYGLREFSQNKYANVFPTSLKDYYPDGIFNSDGEEVTDLWEECAIRSYTGEAVHAKWVEIKNHKEQCYQMCRNNPVWLDYLKKIIKIQIDAGTQGVQLDECELPMTAFGAGGCFCKDCMKQFKQYLHERKAEGKLGQAWEGIDIDAFDYAAFIRDNHINYPEDENDPYYRDYWEFQVRAVRKYFSELSDYAKDYARTAHNRDVLISGNFYNFKPAYYPIEPKVDVLITEMEHTLFRQPYFYRYCAGFAGDKPLLVAENPYGGIVPKMAEMMDVGKGYDLYRVFLLEASMYGCNMSVPYGGWMGNTLKKSFCPPRHVTEQVQSFLYNHEDFYPRGPVKGAAVLYSFGSYYWREATKGGGGGNGMQDNFRDLMDATTADWHDPDIKRLPFWDIIKEMSALHGMYDIKMLPDGELRADDFTADQIADYPMIVIPDCDTLTENQSQIVWEYAEKGGQVLVYGRPDVERELAKHLRTLPNVTFVDMPQDADEGMAAFRKAFEPLYEKISTVTCSHRSLGMQRYDKDGRTIIHLMNYAYDGDKDAVQPVPEVTLTIREAQGEVKAITLDDAAVPFTCTKADDTLIITLQNVPLYTVVTIG